MFTRIHRNLHDERGIAIVVALLVTVVVTLLSIAVIAQSIHDLDASGYDRRRLLSVNAAEAGTNAWYAYLQTTELEDFDCAPLAETIATQPSTASFSASATFFESDGTTEMTCPFSTTSYPSFARIDSTGTVNGVERQVQTLIELTPSYGGWSAAVLAVNGTTFGNRFNIYGDEGEDGDIYVLNGNLTITNAISVIGNVYVPNGSATLSNAVDIAGDLWARDDVVIENPAVVEGSALSSQGNVNGGSTGGRIDGSAIAYGSVNAAGNLTIGGELFPNTDLGPVPTQTFPQITADTAPWVAAGYTLVSFTGATACSSAYNWIQGSGAGTWATSGITDAVVRVSGCTTPARMTNGNNDTITLRGNLAILSDTGYDWRLRSTWTSTGAQKNLYFITAYSTTCSGTSQDISVSNNTTFNTTYTQVFFYTPCTATMSNQNAFEGQVMAQNVSIANNWQMNFEPVLVPGQSQITGFKQNIAYVAEV
jgi:hypothetical protein